MTVPSPGREERIDWAALQARLAEAAEATRKAAKPSRQQTVQILDDRARALAEPRADVSAGGGMLQLLSFRLDRERFGLEMRYVRAVGREPDITPIPQAAAFVLGLTNFRGEIVAVFDLRALLDSRPRGAADRPRVLFLGTHRIEFAIAADTVDEVTIVAADGIGRRPWRLEAGCDMASGLTPDALNVLDGEALLNDRRLFIDQAPAELATAGGKS
jgi:purine-binding chemotaxis protein CheW